MDSKKEFDGNSGAGMNKEYMCGILT